MITVLKTTTIKTTTSNEAAVDTLQRENLRKKIYILRKIVTKA